MPTDLGASSTTAVAGRAGLMDAVRDAQRALVAHLIPEMLSRGLTPHQFWPLYHIARGSESHPAELARRLGITKPACTACVDHLVDAGLIVRRRSASDRRQVVLAVTPKGRRVLAAAWREVDAWIEETTARVSKRDVATTARVLRVMADPTQALRAVRPRAGEVA